MDLLQGDLRLNMMETVPEQYKILSFNKFRLILQLLVVAFCKLIYQLVI